MHPACSRPPSASAYGALTGFLVLLSLSAVAAPVPIDTAVNPANGHTYYLMESSSWTNAEAAAISLRGHLVTINDATENQWVLDRWGTNRNLWIGLHAPVMFPNFVWVSGETATYRNWRAGEPNGDRHTYMYSKNLGIYAGLWNDAPVNFNPMGSEPPLHGVVEVEICTPHRATASAVVVNGFVVSAQIADAGCGYTNTPVIFIEGGGGMGATATAVLTDGRVTQINITSAGCCYTNAPKIVISSPPMVPTVSTRVSKVAVTQNVVLGWKYVLESSHDLANWSPAGPEFVAESETIVREFDPGETGRFFRLRVVP